MEADNAQNAVPVKDTLGSHRTEEKKDSPKKKAQRYYVGTSCYIRCIRIDIENGPYKTISAAIEAAEPGGIILVGQGKYAESIVIRYSKCVRWHD